MIDGRGGRDMHAIRQVSIADRIECPGAEGISPHCGLQPVAGC